jgi:hypothetical protein
VVRHFFVVPYSADGPLFIAASPAGSRLLGGKQWWDEGGGKHPAGKKRREAPDFAGKQALGVDLELPRAAGAPDRILPRRGQHGNAGSFIGLASVPAGFWGRGCGRVFGPKPKKRASGIFRTVLEPPVKMLLDH